MRHIITRQEFDRSEEECRKFILENEIISPSKGEKAISDLTRQLSYCLLKNGFMGRRFRLFIQDYINDDIINVSFLVETGSYNWRNFIKEEYRGLAIDLFHTRPVGLGSPNSACGEGEFMLLCLSPSCRKPTRGDIEININGRRSIIELKGENPRVTSSVLGNSFRLKTLDICQSFGLRPNLSLRGNILGVQLTSEGSIKEHWMKEFSKLELKERVSFLSEWLMMTKTFNESESLDSATRILHDGFIDTLILRKEIIKYFFKHQVTVRHEFSNMAFFKNDNVKIITSDVSKFFRMVDDDQIKPAGDYFRLNQSANLAWYIDCGLDI
jgi:hypothetical protein